MIWSRKPVQIVHDRNRLAGLDLTATRLRAAVAGAGQVRPLALDGPGHDLLLFLDADRKHPEAGRAGYRLCRKVPHLVCSNFLPVVGRPQVWKGGRHAFSPEAALAAVFEKAAATITAESNAAALALPAYLDPPQAKAVAAAAVRTRLPVRGTVAAPLAVAAVGASAVLAPAKPAADPPTDPDTDGGRPDWVVPMRPPAGGPGVVVVVDADEFALSAAVVAVERDEVRLLARAAWPKASAKAWKDRLIDALSDRCVRLCRRDPRDSADAEQALFEQLDTALDRVRLGHGVTVTVRAAHWYQDLLLQPADFDGYCSPLAKLAVDGLRDVTAAAGLPAPPRAVWLTAAAGQLPGLANAVYQHTAEQTEVSVLGPDAVAAAAATLAARWAAGSLPKAHLDAAIPLEPPAEPARPHSRTRG